MDNKIIEEMARIIAFDLCPNRHVHAKWGKEAQCYSDNNFAECKEIKNVVDKLINAGYRKESETAKKFAERAKEVLGSRFNYIDSLIKSKIDEIAKEFTEGEQGKLDEQKNCIYEQRKELDFVWWECSACGSGFNFYANTPYENRFHYCPYCGAKIAECKELQNERND